MPAIGNLPHLDIDPVFLFSSVCVSATATGVEEEGDGRVVEEKRPSFWTTSSRHPSTLLIGSLEREGEVMVGGSSARFDSRVGPEGGIGAMGSKTRREMSNEFSVYAGSSWFTFLPHRPYFCGSEDIISSAWPWRLAR